MTDRTVPADPREALAYDRDALAMDLEALRASMPVLLGSGSYSTTVSVHMLDRLYRAALAARQDEPSPALREAWRHASRCETERGGRDEDCTCGLTEFRATLAANPPQTREAEGAARMIDYVPPLDDIKERDGQTEPTPDRALPIGPGSKYDHARRPTSTYHLDSADVAMGDRHVLLGMLRDARTPEAQRDEENR